MSKNTIPLIVIGFLLIVIPWSASFDYSKLKTFITIIGFLLITAAIASSYNK